MEEFVLTDDLYLGKGLHKAAWIHPNDNKLCIKVPFKENDAELQHELKYRRIRAKRHLQSSALTAYYGTVATNKGLGYVFERVVNTCKGEITACQTMQKFLDVENKKKQPDIGLVRYVLRDLQQHLFREKILTNSTTPVNFLLQYNDDSVRPRVRIIDNIGSSVWIPLVYYFDFFAMQHIRRYWQRFADRLCHEYPDFIQRKWLELEEDFK